MKPLGRRQPSVGDAARPAGAPEPVRAGGARPAADCPGPGRLGTAPAPHGPTLVGRHFVAVRGCAGPQSLVGRGRRLSVEPGHELSPLHGDRAGLTRSAGTGRELSPPRGDRA